MKFLTLIFAGLRRNPMRITLTTISIVIAFVLFGLLKPVADVFESGPNIAGSNRLIVAPKHSISDMLTLRHAQQIRQIPDATIVAYQTFFGGTFREESNSFIQWAVSNDFFKIYDLALIPRSQLDAFYTQRTAAIVGRTLADEYDFNIGDKIPLVPNIWHNRDGKHWEFDLVGIFDVKDSSTDTRVMFIRYDFLDEYRAFGHGLISNVLVSVGDPDKFDKVAAEIDALFANSTDETLTYTERAYALSFVKQLGNVGLIVNGILFAVFFTILLLTANTMSQAIRDRIPEFAILKTLGFQEMTILWLVLAESVVVIVIGALLGMGAAALGLLFIDEILPVTNPIGLLSLSAEVFFTGVGVAILTGVMVGLPPAFLAKRINIIEALRRS